MERFSDSKKCFDFSVSRMIAPSLNCNPNFLISGVSSSSLDGDRCEETVPVEVDDVAEEWESFPTERVVSG